MSSLSEACDALSAFEGGRISLLYDEPGFALSVTAQAHGGWFWCAYDRTAGKASSCGRGRSVALAARRQRPQGFAALREPNRRA
jgi:hypothetical protein